MAKSNQIPILEIPKLDQFHFGQVNWNFARQHDKFHINRLEDARDKLSFPIPPHRKTVHDLLFITEGESTRSKGLTKYTFGKNHVFFLPAYQITSHENMTNDVKGFFLHFAPDLFAEKVHLLKPFSFLHFTTNPIVSIPEKGLSPILNILERLLELYAERNRKEFDLIVWYLMSLFTEISRYAIPSDTDVRNSAALLTQQYKDALTQHIYTYRAVQDYAKLLHVTPNHLNKCVKKTLNKTAQTVLNEMLILEAKSLLKYSQLSISEIAEQLCKSTPSNFSRFFKSQTGLSPKEYVQK